MHIKVVWLKYDPISPTWAQKKKKKINKIKEEERKNNNVKTKCLKFISTVKMIWNSKISVILYTFSVVKGGLSIRI